MFARQRRDQPSTLRLPCHTPLPSICRFTLAAACLLAPVAARAQDNNASSWRFPTPPPGTNTAAFPVPHNDWISHFAHNIDRVKNKRVDLIFDGDSITDFWEGKGKEVWEKNYARLNPADFGISGDRTEHLLWRLDHGQVDGLHPKLVALMIGTNNLGANTETQIAEAIADIVHDYQKRLPDAVILLQAIFPRGEKPTDANRQKIKTINAMIAKLGDGNKVIYMDFGDKFLEPDGTISKEVMPDSLHPSAKGYEIWADAIRPEIQKVLGMAPQ